MKKVLPLNDITLYPDSIERIKTREPYVYMGRERARASLCSKTVVTPWYRWVCLPSFSVTRAYFESGHSANKLDPKNAILFWACERAGAAAHATNCCHMISRIAAAAPFSPRSFFWKHLRIYVERMKREERGRERERRPRPPPLSCGCSLAHYLLSLSFILLLCTRRRRPLWFICMFRYCSRRGVNVL